MWARYSSTGTVVTTLNGYLVGTCSEYAAVARGSAVGELAFANSSISLPTTSPVGSCGSACPGCSSR